MRDLEDVITVKAARTHSFESVRCLFTVCLPTSMISDHNVYQLERYRVQTNNQNDAVEGSKMKLVLISGVTIY